MAATAIDLPFDRFWLPQSSLDYHGLEILLLDKGTQAPSILYAKCEEETPIYNLFLNKPQENLRSTAPPPLFNVVVADLELLMFPFQPLECYEC